MCLYPKLIKNPKYKSNKKNGGNIPEMKDKRVEMVPIGCGECMECVKQKANNWIVRLMEDIKTYKNGKFITLTFSNESYAELAGLCKGEGYTLDNNIATLAVRRFLERWRKKYKKSIRHWLVTELGQNNTEHLHLHGIIYTDNVEEIERVWGYGFVWKGKKQNEKIINYVNEETITYITKYITKKDPIHKTYKPVILCSAGIGNGYTKTHNFKLNKYNGDKTDETYKTKKGHKKALPIYYRNKAYSEEQREQLWINKLDKQKRYVCGEEIDVSKGDQTYLNILKFYQNKNKELGYGNGERTWTEEQYERERRILKQKERINKISRKDIFLKNNKKSKQTV